MRGSFARRVLWLALLLLAACGAEPSGPRPLHLGAGPGLPRMLAEALTRHMTGVTVTGVTGADVRNTELVTLSVGDCCAAISPWALASRELDMAIMCPDAARVLLARNADYVLAGPVVLAGDVLVRRRGDTSPIRQVGMAHQRSPQRQLIRQVLGDSAEIVEMLPAALPYALERGVVQAVVLDRLLAAQSPMQLVELAEPAESAAFDRLAAPAPVPAPTQVLVLHRRVHEEQGPALARALGAAIQEANAALAFLPPLKSVTQGEPRDWTKTSTRFVSPPALP